MPASAQNCICGNVGLLALSGTCGRGSVTFLRRIPLVAGHWPHQLDSSFSARDKRVCHLFHILV